MNLMPRVTAAQLLIVRQSVTTVDVREPEEFERGRIPGSTNVPLGQLPGRFDEFERRRPVVVACHSGSRRSQLATELLARAGFMVSILAGGVNGWVAEGLPFDTSTVTRRPPADSALTDDERRFVDSVIKGLDEDAERDAHRGTAEPAAGPDPADLSRPRRVGPDELARRLIVREWVVDLRPRAAFAAAHLPGSLNIELSDDFATHVSSLHEWGSPLTLIAEDGEQATHARLALMRRGIHPIAGAAIGVPKDLAGGRPMVSYPVTDFAGLATALASRDKPMVLDVRHDAERADGGVRGSRHIPVHRLSGRIREVLDPEVWVYSGSGSRAAIAASMLERAGHRPVLVDGHYDDPATGAAAVGLHAPTGLG